MNRPRAYSPLAIDAAQLLGAQVRAARHEHRWTIEDLAERVGVSHVSIRKVERGDTSIGLGIAFEAAALAGVPLFSEDVERRALESARVADRLAVLPKRSRRPLTLDNDF